MKKENKNSESHSLRQKAEEFLKNKHSKSTSHLSEADVVKLIHEFEVHQVELEMQNEELIKARSNALDAVEKYTSLYEFAPVAYFTISKSGNILEVNLRGTLMLDCDRSHLQNSLFDNYVSVGNKSIFKTFLKNVLSSKDKESCEVALSCNANMPIFIHLTGVSTENGEQCLLTAVDITERIIVEDALRESREQFKMATENFPDGIIVLHDTEYRYVFAEGAGLAEMGLSKGMLLGKRPRDLFPPEFYEILEPKISDALNGIKATFEIGLGDNYFSETVVPVKNKNNKIVAVMGVIHNITTRKLAENSLKETTALLLAQLDSTIDGILVVDPNQKRILTNKRIIELFDVPSHIAEEEYDSSLLQHVVSLTRNPSKFLEKVTFLFDHPGEISRDEIEFKNGMILDRYSSPVIDKDGKNLGRLWIFRDITERKQAEEKVREKDIQFRKLSSQLPDLIYQFTKKPDGSYCVPIASAGIKNIFGCSPEDVLDDFGPIARVVFPEDSARVISDIEYSAEHLTYFTCEFRVQIPGREIQWILSKSVPEKLEDGSITWYGFNADITAMKNTEQVLIKAKEKAEESDRLKSAFLTNMSHEIRTPMNGILGFAGLLKEPDLTGEEQQKFIRIIEKSGKRMLNIINDIIDISKIESGQMEIFISKTNVNTAIETFFAFFKPEVEQKGLKFSFRNSLPNKNAEILTDSKKLDSILTNLVKNAIKFTKDGSIEFGYITVNETHDEFLQFFVKDTGIGIPKDRQEAIFERFIQADINDKQAYQGAGLGLSISKAYVEMLGGKIWVETEEGKGSIFYFTIPYIIEQPPQPIVADDTSKNNEAGQINNLKILVADDDETSDLLITTMLKHSSNEIIHVTTGDQSVDSCRNNPNFDLVLMDIKMPGIGGYEATRQIRQFNKDVIIIAQTAHGLTGDRENAIESGCNDYISKPIDRDELMALIQKYFSKQTTPPPR